MECMDGDILVSVIYYYRFKQLLQIRFYNYYCDYYNTNK